MRRQDLLNPIGGQLPMRASIQCARECVCNYRVFDAVNTVNCPIAARRDIPLEGSGVS